MNPSKRRQIFERLRAANPDPTSELTHQTPFELLVAVVLSAQATDKGVNKATDRLYRVANTPAAIVELGIEGLTPYISSIGLFNMEIHLDRRMAEKRIYPAINVNRSGTRREELLLKPDILQKVWVLRKLLYPMDELEAMEFLLDKVKGTKSNADFFDSMRRG